MKDNLIATGSKRMRDTLARGCIALRLTPNALTVLGTLITAVGGLFFAMGAQSSHGMSLAPDGSANAYLLLAALMLLLASACDVLDGAVARLGKMSTEFGGFLDSTLDRFSDFVVYAGIAASYAWSSPANVTFILLCMLAAFNAFQVSYTRARAEDLIAECKVGFWQRPERSGAILVAALAHNIPALVVQQSLFVGLTVLCRIRYTRAVLAGKPNPAGDPGSLWVRASLWRRPRGSWGYCLAAGAHVAWLVFARFEPVDWLRDLIG